MEETLARQLRRRAASGGWAPAAAAPYKQAFEHQSVKRPGSRRGRSGPSYQPQRHITDCQGIGSICLVCPDSATR
eukprot:640977-Pyramimonas_sp.AAC.1